MTVTDKTTKKSPLNLDNYPLLVVEVEGSVCNRALRYVHILYSGQDRPF